MEIHEQEASILGNFSLVVSKVQTFFSQTFVLPLRLSQARATTSVDTRTDPARRLACCAPSAAPRGRLAMPEQLHQIAKYRKYSWILADRFSIENPIENWKKVTDLACGDSRAGGQHPWKILTGGQ